MARTFDPYEYIAVIAPGFVVALGLVTQWPELRELLKVGGFTAGDLGIVLIASFVLGHLVQAGGNLLEWLLWRPFGGMPSLWIRRKGHLLSLVQRQLVAERLSDMLGRSIDLDNVAASELTATVPQVFSKVRAAGRADRIESWTRTYGLLRGLTAAFVLLAAWLAVTQWPHPKFALIAAGAASLAWLRAFRFSRYYGRDLWLEYLNLPATTVPK
jgi:hypothetical protein